MRNKTATSLGECETAMLTVPVVKYWLNTEQL